MTTVSVYDNNGARLREQLCLSEWTMVSVYDNNGVR